MKNSSFLREGLMKVLLPTAAGLLTAFLLFWAAFAPPGATITVGAQTTTEPTSQFATNQTSPEETKRREVWRDSMEQIPLPKKGCFKATYPKTEWVEGNCTTAPPYPQPPRRGIWPFIVGNGNDVTPEVPGFIFTGIGSFDTVTGVTSESGQINGMGPQIANAYSLQLNTNYFPSTACAGSPNPGCRGWEQFIFANNGTQGDAFIQYWLLQYNAPCPAGVGWIPYSFPGSTDIYCYRNSVSNMTTPNQPIGNLLNLRLRGDVTATGDSYTFTDGGPIIYSATGDNLVSAAAGWNAAEFAIVGYAGGGQANFNIGSTIVPRARVIYGGTDPPICVSQGFTGETNNLSFGPTAPLPSAPGPALIFTQSNGGTVVANCAAATAVGDTHLRTFNGLFYDFQASGDFVLAQADRNFVVQTRQVSGAPSWPNASVNSAVATQVGKSKVAICLEPAGLNIDGKVVQLGAEQSMALPDDASVARRGNVYVIRDQNGNSVRAQVNPTWIDVSVGLGRWPAEVSGLLANVNGNVNQIAARNGAVLTNPFPFEELYNHYADSWRVPERESLLSVCGGKSERGSPTKPFYANDLEPEVYKRARAVCTAAGVKEEPFLDACTLDVAVIGSDEAAKVFVDMPAPVAVGKPVVSTFFERPGLLKWLLLGLLLVVLIAIIVWFLKKRKT